MFINTKMRYNKHLPEWLREYEMSEFVGQLEPLYIAHDSLNWYNHFRELYVI